ncbi:hypothetical protein HKBW3S03_00981 [Candidatus Hakubella thermalkaliphila]|uniref:Uncharacterized protein n=1 Tax=Candidatus Hakubella thermalkaliphila TaxID=2754717 RepID=A0A6V8NLS3_9ACTN|nr:hypothetical protein [Candidatus Hakubella thermalkaliphila]GFP19476.1 hypothetical protein HKBW3S03_00981 [Candidatus Hakubella thermalkaliphila]
MGQRQGCETSTLRSQDPEDKSKYNAQEDADEDRGATRKIELKIPLFERKISRQMAQKGETLEYQKQCSYQRKEQANDDQYFA